MKSDELGTRMKMYEAVSDQKLIRKIPVLGRIDGKAFSTLTRGMKAPWDEDFIECMKAAALAVCRDAQGCKLGYVQSDEISILLTDTEKISTEPWFGYESRKLCSIAASTATAAFLMEYMARFPERAEALRKGNSPLPRFDARFWNLPEREVPNYFVWRQQDAVRNSKQMLGRAYFSHKQLHKKSSNEIMKMVYDEHGINAIDFETKFIWGTLISRAEEVEEVTWVRDGETMTKLAKRKNWKAMDKTPLVSYQDFFQTIPGTNTSVFRASFF